MTVKERFEVDIRQIPIGEVEGLQRLYYTQGLLGIPIFINDNIARIKTRAMLCIPPTGKVITAIDSKDSYIQNLLTEDDLQRMHLEIIERFKDSLPLSKSKRKRLLKELKR